MKPQLIFVYNAGSGLFNAVTDFAHKILSPSTYHCNLCRLTYGNFSMNNEWEKFIEQLPYDIVFLYKDEFIKRFKIAYNLPAIFINKDGLQEIISSSEIISCNSLKELQILITQKVVLTNYSD